MCCGVGMCEALFSSGGQGCCWLADNMVCQLKGFVYATICKGLALVEAMGTSQALWQRGAAVTRQLPASPPADALRGLPEERLPSALGRRGDWALWRTWASARRCGSAGWR